MQCREKGGDKCLFVAMIFCPSFVMVGIDDRLERWEVKSPSNSMFRPYRYFDNVTSFNISFQIT